MNKVYIVFCTTINEMEPTHYSSHKYESIHGVYKEQKSAIAKIDELFEQYSKASLNYPEWTDIRQECRIEEYELNP